MPIYNMSRKFKKFSLQYSYLKMEKEEVDEICFSVEKNMRSYMNKNYPEYCKYFFRDQVKDPVLEENQELGQEIEIKVESPKNIDLKKLYRRIASKIHPDKTNEERESKLFAEAAQAYSENDIGKMIEIAALINIEIAELSFETIALLRDNIEKITKHITLKKQTTGWAWHKTKTEEDKLKIVKYILSTRGISI